MSGFIIDLGMSEFIFQNRATNVRATAIRDTLKATVKLRKDSKIGALRDRLKPPRTLRRKVVAATPNEKTGEKTDAGAIESEMGKSHELTANQIERTRTLVALIKPTRTFPQLTRQSGSHLSRRSQIASGSRGEIESNTKVCDEAARGSR